MVVKMKPRPQFEVFLGIDPGASGGLACILGGGQVLKTSMPTSEYDVWEWFEDIGERHRTKVFALIEQVHSMPGDGHVGAFKFGKSYGGLRMALTAAGIPFDDVSPQKWTSEFVAARLKGKKCDRCEGSGKHRPQGWDDGRGGRDESAWTRCERCKGIKKVGGESKQSFKNRLKDKAQQLFPREKVTLATADALLIAEYARRQFGGRV